MRRENDKMKAGHSAPKARRLGDAELALVAGGWGFNETATLVSSILKKRDDAANAVIAKI